ncbi:cytochrome P450 [Aaosphaeria arxii CBS 175.79]|uniref:Cytochrome P450 n=1 Tax=Aaosphaeria arxii CBS 175.79 TaxID=1450172 RepID=A0A6A5Y765_9PLEO|nr:cytochrome P450 [Aaosphaeria arxii CBS 175.79]KAF2021402.1 cytochrome P450 [Aaosphaeria arxii CBS 175.79]
MALPTTVAAVIAVASLLWFAITYLFRTSVNDREPPVIEPSIPFIGHIIGMSRDGPGYLAKVSAKTNHGIFTMPMLWGRTYVVKTPTLAAQVERTSTTMSFGELVLQVAPRLVGLKPETREILKDQKAVDEGRDRMGEAVLHGVIEPLLSIKSMSIIGHTQLRNFAEHINNIKDGFETDLYEYINSVTTLATMNTFYGPNNPFAVRPELVDHFWNWENGLILYMMEIFPQWTSRKAYIAMEEMTKGFSDYIEAGRMSEGYELVRRRHQAHVDEGICLRDRARLEVGMCLAFNVNAAITMFWVLDNIFSRPELHAEVQEEIRKNALVGESTLSCPALRESCPLLNSVYKETMRLTSPLNSARYVKSDTVIADTYVVRADTIVQVSGVLLHADEGIWGPDAAEFNPRRFIHTPNGTKTSPDGSTNHSRANQIPSVAFRGFGGGGSLCPGRHFAQMEILALVSSFILGFDIEAPKGQTGGIKWNPPSNKKEFTLTSHKPLKPVNVRFQRKKGFEDAVWKFEF